MKISTRENILSSEQLILLLSGEIDRSIQYFMNAVEHLRAEKCHLICSIDISDGSILEDVLRGHCSPCEFDYRSATGVIIHATVNTVIDHRDIVIFNGENDQNGEKAIIQWISDVYCVSKL